MSIRNRQGWFGESSKHALASKGVKTSLNSDGIKSSYKVEDVRNIAYKVLDEWEGEGMEFEDCKIIGDCTFIAKELVKELKKKGYPASYVYGYIGKSPYEVSKHAWVRMRGSYFEGIDDNSPVIVDPTISQFRSDIASQGLVDVDLGTNLPKVGIYSKKDEEFGWYNP